MTTQTKNTLVINLYGAPSAGKSTMAAYIFSQLKWAGIDCELVGEFAKELVWEQRYQTFKDEVYIFAKQNHRLFRVNGQVDVIITDRPIALSIFYNNKYGDNSEAFENLVMHEHTKYNNFDVFIIRDKPYNPNGRNQTEEESDAFSGEILTTLESVGINPIRIKGNKESADDLVGLLLTQLRKEVK